jgi:hypothetical protein
VPSNFGEFDLADRGMIECLNGSLKVLDMTDEFQNLITDDGKLVSIS